VHPKELSHMAFAAASAARMGGFRATAEALLALAAVCEREAISIDNSDCIPEWEERAQLSLSDFDTFEWMH
jgi:hypothetical protein